MKLAIFSDVHSNPKAFRIAYKDAKERNKCDSIVCLGDVVGYGPNPLECIDEVREKCDFCILGNHDAGVLGKLRIDWFSETAANGIKRQKDIIFSSKERYDWLNSLGYTRYITLGNDENELKVQFSHGHICNPSEFDYITCPSDSRDAFDKMQDDGTHILFVGHTHMPAGIFTPHCDKKINWWLRKEKPYWFELDEPKKIDIDRNKMSIINVGSIGYPRVCHHTVYSILDTDNMTVEWVFLPFNLEEYAIELEDNGIEIPNWLSWQLSKD